MEAHPETRNARKGEGARGGTDVSFPTAWLSDPHFNNLPQASVGLLVRLIMESANLGTDGKLESLYLNGQSTLLWIRANPDWEKDLPPLEAWGKVKARRSNGKVESVRLDWSEQASALYLETQAKRNRRNVKQARERQKKADLEQKKQAEKLAENFPETSLETSQKPHVTSVSVSGYGSDYVGKDKDRIGKDKDRTKEEAKNLEASSISGAPPVGLSSAPLKAWSAPYSAFKRGGEFEEYANDTGEPRFYS